MTEIFTSEEKKNAYRRAEVDALPEIKTERGPVVFPADQIRQITKSPVHEVECPTCSEPTPTVLFCDHAAAVCVTCCQRDHNTRCPTCRGTTNVREWVYPTGFNKPEPCPDCGGTGRKDTP